MSPHPTAELAQATDVPANTEALQVLPVSIDIVDS